MFLLDSILLAPVKGVMWMGEKLAEIADIELGDTGRIKENLMALQLQFELDEISQEEYDQKENELLDRLDALTEAEDKET